MPEQGAGGGHREERERMCEREKERALQTLLLCSLPCTVFFLFFFLNYVFPILMCRTSIFDDASVGSQPCAVFLAVLRFSQCVQVRGALLTSS